ncbi:MAG: protein kinase [Planctomycetes bacterium]|nr:protein kinase [Planctomycetota bacterium]
MRIDHGRRLLLAKIVYCGPGLAGKTTNLALVRANAPAGSASELASEEAHSERTVHFHLQCTEFGLVHGCGIQAEFWTIPGQSYYAGTRRQLLAGADGVVFVADSRREALDENIESMNEMLGNLRHHGLPEDLPVVMQYNKQDAPTALKREQLDPLMNVRGWPSFAAVASEGRGVLETVHEVLRLVVEMGKAAEMPAAPAPRSWLIACHRCQAMLEVPTAAAGEVYTCGVCGSQLEVVDGDRGITRQPEHSQAQSVLPPDEYAPVEQAAQPHAAGAAGALEVGELSPAAAQPTIAAGGVGAPGEASYGIPGFTVVAELDRSAQGVRHRVRETSTGRSLRALELAPALLNQPGYREQIEPYARLAGQVKHPNILPLVGVRTNGEAMVFLSADPPDHEPLSLVLARRRALAPPHAMGLLRQMALALEEGARHGAVHGWLRPDCVLVSGDGNVLVDELSVPVNHRFLVRELAGASAATEYYLAPEHLSDETRSDVRSDMFLLGAVLFRMMTGEGLVTGYNAHEALHKISANGPRMLRDAVQGISRELNIFYQKLVAVDRRERFQGYRELIDQLDRFGGGAKRQNLQLTAAQRNPSGRPGQPGHGHGHGHGQGGRRPSSQQHGGGHPSGQAGVSTVSRSRLNQPGGGAPAAQPAAQPRRKGSGAGMGVAVVVVAILAAAVAVAVVLHNERRPPVGSEQPPAPEPVPPPRVTAPVPTPAPVLAKTAEPQRSAIGPSTGGATPPKPPQTQAEAAARMELQRRIADLMVGERFAEATAMAARIEPPEVRDLQLQAIRDRHGARRRELEDKVERGLPLEDLGAALAPALTLWGMPGDDDWARTLMVRARTRDQAKALPPSLAPVPAATVASATGAEAKDDPGSAAAGVLVTVKAEPAAAALGQLEQALGANQPALAQQAFDAIPAATPEGRSLRLLAELWGQRIAFLQRLLGQRSRLRVLHPTTGDQWDLTAADAQGVTLTSAAGSGSNLSWSQLPPRQQGKLFVDAALFPGATPGEQATAVAMQLVADDPVQAAALMRRARSQLAPEQAADLERLVDLHQRRALVGALLRGQEAVKRNDMRALDAALTEVRRADRQVQKQWQDAIAQLELVAAAANARKK